VTFTESGTSAGDRSGESRSPPGPLWSTRTLADSVSTLMTTFPSPEVTAPGYRRRRITIVVHALSLHHQCLGDLVVKSLILLSEDNHQKTYSQCGRGQELAGKTD
jgi:hypothetical protein